VAIATLADYLAAARTTVLLGRGQQNGQSSAWRSSWIVAGVNHSAGSLSIGNTTTGIVPTDATAGAPPIPDFTGVGHLTRAEFMRDSTVECHYVLYDRLFHAGSFANTIGTTTLGSQPSFSSRVPGGDYKGLEIWVENNGIIATATMRVQYTNQDGTPGQVTPTITMPTTVTSGAARFPFAAGDCGVQAIENFEVTVAGTGGTYNVLVVRPLLRFSSRFADTPLIRWLDQTGMPVVYNDSCLAVLSYFSGGSTVPSFLLDVEIASG